MEVVEVAEPERLEPPALQLLRLASIRQLSQLALDRAVPRLLPAEPAQLVPADEVRKRPVFRLLDRRAAATFW